MSTSLVLILASSHSSVLASFIGRLPSLNWENVAGKSAAVIQSMSGLSVVATLRTEWIGFVVPAWFEFHLKLLPSVCSFSSCNRVDSTFDPM